MLAVGSSLGATGLGWAQIRPSPSPSPSPRPAIDVPDCVTVRAESRANGMGFSHVVIVSNRCTTAVTCELGTDADPSPRQSLRVAAGQTGEIVTRVASPAPGVTALASCRLEGPAARSPGTHLGGARFN